MPRIRKKTSKRGTTNQREKIKHKVSETRKKRKKDAKKNTQWKSKNKKDPGIPNNFPYKDQILAEIAEQRRQAAEEKERRKEEKRKAKAAASAGDNDDGSERDGSETGFDGIDALRGATLSQRGKTRGAQAAMVVDGEDIEEDIPMLVYPELPNLKAVLELADVVLEVLDARDPSAYRIPQVEKTVKAKDGHKSVLVLNKIDMCPREAVLSWTTALRNEHPTFLFRSASAFLPAPEPTGKGKGKERADDGAGVDAILSYLQQLAQEKTADEPLVVAVVGLANVGKTSLVNSLLRKAALSTYQLSSSPQDGPTTTRHAQEVTLDVGGKSVRLIDTPGVSWLPLPADTSAEMAERIRARDILVRNRGRIDRLKDPLPVVTEILSRSDRQDLMLFYNLPAFADGDTNAFLSGVSRANGLIKKHGALDLAGASRIVLRDWNTGKFPRYTVPPSGEAAPLSLSSVGQAAHDVDEKVLGTLRTRREMSKAEGVIKLRAAEVEARVVDVEATWLGGEDASESEGEEDEGQEDELDELEEDELEEDEDDEGGEGEGEEEDEDESEEEDEPLEPAPSGKRKRLAIKPTAPSRPVKKVAFSVEPQSTKQARSAAGARGSKLAAPKKAANTKQAPKKSGASKSAPKRAANVPSQKAAVASAGGEEAYDFKKFF